MLAVLVGHGSGLLPAAKWCEPRPSRAAVTAPLALTSLRYPGNPRGCSSMVRVPAFQAGYAGSIPVTRSGPLLVVGAGSGRRGLRPCSSCLGMLSFCHRRFEILVLELLRRNASVLFDLLGLALGHLVNPERDHSAGEHDASSRPAPPSTHHPPWPQTHACSFRSTAHGEARAQGDVRPRRPTVPTSASGVRTVVPQMLRVVSYRSLGAEQLRHPERALSRLSSREHRRHRRAAADSARRGHRIDRGRKGPVHHRRMRRFQERRGPVTRACCNGHRCSGDKPRGRPARTLLHLVRPLRGCGSPLSSASVTGGPLTWVQ